MAKPPGPTVLKPFGRLKYATLSEINAIQNLFKNYIKTILL
ncbi:hypothetical protein [Paenibacillus macquariensis]|nr:hypothetical protein [Paenibacillus macquariensis]